jgi:hypothetical protein
MHDLTMDEILNKMKKVHMQVIDIAVADCLMMGFPKSSLTSLASHRAAVQTHESAWFNSAENYKEATQEALQAKSTDVEALISSSRGGVSAEDSQAVASVCLAVLVGQLAGVDKKLITDETVLLIAQSGAGTIESNSDFSGTEVTASGLQAMLENLSAGRLAGSLTFNGMVLDPRLSKLDLSGKLADQAIASMVSAFLQCHARCCV